jgi:hypothetical protein
MECFVTGGCFSNLLRRFRSGEQGNGGGKPEGYAIGGKTY